MKLSIPAAVGRGLADSDGEGDSDDEFGDGELADELWSGVPEGRPDVWSVESSPLDTTA
jgi:hypothetical protein